jgi:hypothetical protein
MILALIALGLAMITLAGLNFVLHGRIGAARRLSGRLLPTPARVRRRPG